VSLVQSLAQSQRSQFNGSLTTFKKVLLQNETSLEKTSCWNGWIKGLGVFVYVMRERHMKARKTDEMRREYDFSGGVRGKYVKRLAKGANVVVLDKDVASVFPDSVSVNKALRAIVEVGRSAGGKKMRPITRTAKKRHAA
jgi:hypothetical protein